MDEKILQVLTDCPLFDGMDARQINNLLASVDYRVVHIDRQNLYAVAGDACNRLDVVLSGELVTQMAAPSGKFVEVTTLRPGNVVAPAFVFARRNALPVTVQAATDVDLLRVPVAEFRRLVDADERIRWNFVALLSNINAFLTGKIKVLSLLSVREKLGHLLLDLSRRQGSTTVVLEKSRQEIADAFGIQKYSVIRQLGEFQKEGIIRIEGKKVTILNSELLKNEISI